MSKTLCNKGCGVVIDFKRLPNGRYMPIDAETKLAHSCSGTILPAPSKSKEEEGKPDYSQELAGAMLLIGSVRERLQLLDKLKDIPSKDDVLKACEGYVEDIVKREVHRLVPIQVNVTLPNGSVASTVIGKQHKNLPLVLKLVAMRKNTYLCGPSGSGKTETGVQIAKALGAGFYPMSMGPATTEYNIMGYRDAGGNYQPSTLFKPFVEGGLWFIDEIDAGSAESLTCLGAPLANQFCSFPHGVFPKHENFICMAAANTWGSGADREYVGGNQLDARTLNRFNFIPWDYDTDLEHELARAKSVLGDDKQGKVMQWCERVWALRASARQSRVRIVFGTRDILEGADMILGGLDSELVESLRFWFRASEDDKQKVLANV